MRYLIIIVLAGAVVWLVMERMRLTDELAVAKAAVQKLEEEKKAPPPPVVPGQRPGTSTWMQEQLNRSGKSLDAPPQVGARPR